MQLRVHGARGSSGVSGPQFVRYGGHTTCYSTALPDGYHIIFDCGSGLLNLQSVLAISDDHDEPFRATVFLTHIHWDHIQGLPVFAPLYKASTRIHFVAASPEGMSLEAALDAVIRPPWFPVRFVDVPAQITFERLTQQPVQVQDVEITSAELHHPGGVRAYRIAQRTRSLVLATDFEAGHAESDEALLRLAAGADVLVHDAQYTPIEWQSAHRGWGHSTWEHASSLARSAGVGRLLLTSHDPSRTDNAVDAIVRSAREHFPATEAAFQGQILDF